MTHSKGISWIDDCRIPFTDDYGDKKGNQEQKKSGDVYGFASYDKLFVRAEPNTQGRFPANILVSDDMLNDGVISEGKDFILKCKKKNEIYGNGKGFPQNTRTIKQDKGTNSRYYDIDKWFDKMINE